ncbi:hypothetical protein BDN72DRAFT_465973 [Pluteus cervinus]|uniref:Uncharacterized protein n=1 Tax=Pluteus cervinus TaxID=181527 RepID=A0ACD3A609_9AGAR|nr:hypothetical protein BDN72DRAFT_465973 [Pluteus cervinus]
MRFRSQRNFNSTQLEHLTAAVHDLLEERLKPNQSRIHQLKSIIEAPLARKNVLSSQLHQTELQIDDLQAQRDKLLDGVHHMEETLSILQTELTNQTPSASMHDEDEDDGDHGSVEEKSMETTEGTSL